MSKICPFKNKKTDSSLNCNEEECALWNIALGGCSIKAIARGIFCLDDKLKNISSTLEKMENNQL